jgi:hypothetical protein
MIIWSCFRVSTLVGYAYGSNKFVRAVDISSVRWILIMRGKGAWGECSRCDLSFSRRGEGLLGYLI